jgi:hypothetical protein
MKKIIIFTMLLIIANATFSQQTKPSPALTKQDYPKHSRDHYLKKSKTEKTEAWILLGGGATCIIISFLIPKGEPLVYSGFNFFGPTYKNDNIKGTFGGIGFLSMLTSIKFFIGSSRNKRKAGRATTINFNNQRILFPQQSNFVFKTLPSLTLKISL